MSFLFHDFQEIPDNFITGQLQIFLVKGQETVYPQQIKSALLAGNSLNFV